MIRITSSLSIPPAELTLTATRSGGPGGQHVNKVSTQVTLEFDVAGSPSLSDAQKRRIGERLASRIGADGVMRLRSRRHRSQAANRRDVVERFAELLREALRPRRRRVETSVPAGQRERRLDAKRHRGQAKRARRRPRGDED